MPRRSAAIEDYKPVVPPAPTRIEIADLGTQMFVKDAAATRHP